jgi:hypothetical protein
MQNDDRDSNCDKEIELGGYADWWSPTAQQAGLLNHPFQHG